MAIDTNTRQRQFRERRAREGLRQLAVYLPRDLVKRIDAHAAAQGAGRDQLLTEIIGAAMKPAQTRAPGLDTTSSRWVVGLIGALSDMAKVMSGSKSKAATGALRAAYEQADKAYRAMPPWLRSGEAGKALSYWLGRMDVRLGGVFACAARICLLGICTATNDLLGSRASERIILGGGYDAPSWLAGCDIPFDAYHLTLVCQLESRRRFCGIYFQAA